MQKRNLAEIQDGFIYTAECFNASGRYIKIGFSSRPEVRISALRNPNPSTTLIIPSASVPVLTGKFTGSYELEQRIHRELKEVAALGEWYPAENDLVQLVIAQLKRYDGTDESRNPPQPYEPALIKRCHLTSRQLLKSYPPRFLLTLRCSAGKVDPSVENLGAKRKRRPPARTVKRAAGRKRLRRTDNDETEFAY